ECPAATAKRCPHACRPKETHVDRVSCAESFPGRKALRRTITDSPCRISSKHRNFYGLRPSQGVAAPHPKTKERILLDIFPYGNALSLHGQGLHHLRRIQRHRRTAPPADPHLSCGPGKA